MITWKNSSAVFRVLAAWFVLAGIGSAQTSSKLSSRFLARGEKAVLEISLVGREPDTMPVIPKIPDVGIESSGMPPQVRQLPGRKLEYSFQYTVASYAIGKHVIPAVEVIVGRERTRTEPLEFVIFDPDELEWADVTVGNRQIRYASAFRTLKDRLYVGETVPVELKIFIPRDLAMAVEDWGVPEFERVGMASWRFEPSMPPGNLNLLGRQYISLAYPSTMSSTRAGEIAMGPATVRLTAAQMVLDGFQRREYVEVFLSVPKLDLEAIPLPEGAPDGFENAVGNFTVTASTPEMEPREGDPVLVDLVVSGSGNLDALRPPKLIEADGWKIYEATANQRGDERRQLAGDIVFRQFMRPLEFKPAIPAFRLVYFDPAEEIYKIATTQPIALNMQPAAVPKIDAGGPPQLLPIPLERMNDILAVLRPAQLTLPGAPALSPWLGHVAAGLIALGLIGKALWIRFAGRFRKDPVRVARSRALEEVEKTKTAEDTEFLRSAGRFVERWLGDNPSDEAKAVIAERDAVCFRAEKPGSSLDRNRREQILVMLRKAAMALAVIATLAFTTGTTRAEAAADKALEAYEAAKYEEAAKIWLGAGNYQDLSPDTLYNIGNACYRMGSPGQAALYFRRALLRNPSHAEARQNLRFIERKYGALAVKREEYQYAIAAYPLAAWQGAMWTGVWLAILAVLVFPATRPGARFRVAAIFALVVAPLLAGVGALGWRYFPSESEFAPIARQAVVVAEKTVVHADAARTAPEVIDAPPGSLCEVLKESGRWIYVSFATETRGWIPSDTVERLVPEGNPEAPKIRKPKADGSST